MNSMLAFVVLAVAIILLVPLDPEVKVGDFEPTPYQGKLNASSEYLIQDHYFPSGQDHVSCHAWLYLPFDDENNENNHSKNEDKKTTRPTIIMAGGFAEQKDFGLDVYAEEFVKAGFNVFLFDYRSFGGSQGHPRNYVSPKRHVQDWHAAIDYVSSLHNDTKLGLWGMSFGGGHVLTVASQRHNDTRISGVVAQAPFLKTSVSTKRNSRKRGRFGKLRLVVAALQDRARGFLGMSPVVIPILGIGQQLSMMPTSPESLEAYNALRPKQKLGGWINQGPVRGLFELKSYNPLEMVRHQPPQIPVLLVSGSRDKVCPAHAIDQVSGLLPQARVITRNASHVDIMGPDHAPQVGVKMASFYQECLN